MANPSMNHRAMKVFSFSLVLTSLTVRCILSGHCRYPIAPLLFGLSGALPTKGSGWNCRLAGASEQSVTEEPGLRRLEARGRPRGTLLKCY